MKAENNKYSDFFEEAKKSMLKDSIRRAEGEAKGKTKSVIVKHWVG